MAAPKPDIDKPERQRPQNMQELQKKIEKKNNSIALGHASLGELRRERMELENQKETLPDAPTWRDRLSKLLPFVGRSSHMRQRDELESKLSENNSEIEEKEREIQNDQRRLSGLNKLKDSWGNSARQKESESTKEKADDKKNGAAQEESETSTDKADDKKSGVAKAKIKRELTPDTTRKKDETPVPAQDKKSDPEVQEFDYSKVKGLNKEQQGAQHQQRQVQDNDVAGLSYDKVEESIQRNHPAQPQQSARKKNSQPRYGLND